jgi:hypothetical protein
MSVNGGKTWDAAELGLQPNTHSWVRWSYTWNAKPGDYALMSRATDAGGNVQPVQRDSARRDGYELNWSLPIRCSVR